jgi:twitching motility two-component system response regulator PilG
MNYSDRLRILVVDDSVQVRELMRMKLDEISGVTMPLEVDFANDGESALSKVQDDYYDLVFLDVVMPGMDGYQVCQQVKQIRPVRVVMLTGKSAAVDFGMGRSAGCDHYLTKPPNDVDMRTILRLALLKKATAV